MKSIILIIIAIVVIAFVGYKVTSKTTPPASTNDDAMSSSTEMVSSSLSGTFPITASSSSATWTGSKKLVVNYYDSGTIDITSGEVTVTNGIVTGGKVVFDMKSIAAKTTGSGSGQDMLSKHLKSPDFFDADKYAESTYVVASSTKNTDGSYVLHGTLTAKNKTGALDVSATLGTENGSIVLSGVAEVNRSKWDVRYGSESFFKDLGDKVINDIFTLKFKVVAPVSAQ